MTGVYVVSRVSDSHRLLLDHIVGVWADESEIPDLYKNTIRYKIEVFEVQGT